MFWVSLWSCFPTKLTHKMQIPKKDPKKGDLRTWEAHLVITVFPSSHRMYYLPRPSVPEGCSPWESDAVRVKTSSRLPHSPKTKLPWDLRFLNLPAQANVSWRFCWMCSLILSVTLGTLTHNRAPERWLLPHREDRPLQNLFRPLTGRASSVSTSAGPSAWLCLRSLFFRKHEDVHLKYESKVRKMSEAT